MAKHKIFFNKRQRIHFLSIVLRIGGIVLGVTALIVLCLLIFSDAFFPLVHTAKLSASPEAYFAGSDESIYSLENNTLTCTNTNGKTKWTSKFSGTSLQLSASDSLISVYDEYTAYVLTPEGSPIYSLPNSDFRILQVSCGNSSIAVLSTLTSDSSTKYIRVFDKAGIEIFRSEYTDVDILSYGFSGANDSLWTLTLDSTGVYPISRINISNPAQNTLTGTIEISDQLVSDIFIFNDTMYVSGTNYLTNYDTFGNKGSSTLVYGLKCIASASEGEEYALCYIPQKYPDVSSAFNIRIIAKTELKEYDTFIQLPPDVISVHASLNHIYCFMEDCIYVYKLSGEFEKSISLDFALQKTQKLSSSKLILFGEEDSYYMSIE